jgi:Glycosyltransferase family 87
MAHALAIAVGALLAALVLLVGAGTAPASAAAAATGTTSATTATAPPGVDTPVTGLQRVTDLNTPPAGYRARGRDVVRAAAAVPKIARVVRAHPGAASSVFTKGPGRWQVSWFSATEPPKEIAVVYIDDATGVVTEAWTGYQVAWTMARGYPGAFGRKATAWWIWVPLTLLFVLPFVDRRTPWRGPALDLGLVALFGVSLAFFDHARIGLSVPLAYPLLIALLARLLWLGLRRGRDPAGDRPLPRLVPISWLAVGLVFLLGFRVALNVLDSNVIDVGYAGVIGADKLTHGEQLYGAFPRNNLHGDTYGPILYVLYVPAELLLPWAGRWDGLPAAHAVAIASDLACVLLLFLLGRRLRGPGLGVVLAYAWAACPFTLYALESNSNDELVAVFVLAALLAAARPGLRGAFVGLAGWTKLAPLALAPLFAAEVAPPPGARARRRQRWPGLAYVAGLGAVTALAVALVLAHSDLQNFYDRTLGYQASRESPFSIWGQWGGGWRVAQKAVQAGAVLLAVAVAVVPRRRDVIGLAALAGAVLVAFQLGVTHWFYLYLPWLLGPFLVAVLGRYGSRTCSIESARNGAVATMTTALTHGSSSAGSNLTDSWVRRLSMACSRRTPSTPPRAPVMPTSVQ